jgi:hypothetical protein
LGKGKLRFEERDVATYNERPETNSTLPSIYFVIHLPSVIFQQQELTVPQENMSDSSFINVSTGSKGQPKGQKTSEQQVVEIAKERLRLTQWIWQLEELMSTNKNLAEGYPDAAVLKASVRKDEETLEEMKTEAEKSLASLDTELTELLCDTGCSVPPESKRS